MTGLKINVFHAELRGTSSIAEGIDINTYAGVMAVGAPLENNKDTMVDIEMLGAEVMMETDDN